MYKLQLTIVPRQVGELWDQILEGVLQDVCNPVHQIPVASLPDQIPHVYYPKYNLYQGKCHQQSTPNLCGYHAIFNTLGFLNIIKGGQSEYNIQSGSSFWRFKKLTEEFLFKIKKQHHLPDEWPWRQKDILYGDFERTYNNLCLQKFQLFKIFRKHEAFELYSFTWDFQYQNLLINDEKKRELNKLIDYFKSYKGLKPLVISFMLGITNHWMCLQAVKVGNETQYWFFDSTNRHILDLNEPQMHELAEQLNNERIQFKKEPYTKFFKDHLPIRYKDTQLSLKLIVDCLEGRTTIEHYIYNQTFNIFANQLETHWQTNQEQFIKAVRQYWYNITSFLRYPIRHNLFTPQNVIRYSQFAKAIDSIKSACDEGKRISFMVKKYEVKKNI